ncbi:MAG TPA: membrane protein insertase YidC [Acidobacteriaceae bacterium]|nr:membrane protein insertase YidC [Acidobacteriaceae bacterium]
MAEIQNPNQQGSGGGGFGFDSGSLYGFIIVFVLMVVAFQIWGPKKPQPQPEQKNQPAQTSTPPAAATPAATNATSAAPATPTAPSAAAANTVQASSEKETVVENELYRIVFTNRGADVKSWTLKKYKDDDGKPLDLVNSDTAAKLGLPLSLFTYDAGLRTQLNSALYVPSTTGSVAAPAALQFDYSSGGLTVHKSFSFDASYVIHAEVSVTHNGAPVTAMLAWPGGLGDESTPHEYATEAFSQSISGKTDQIASKKVVGGETLHGEFDYAGISDLYFAAIFIPDTPADSSVVTLHDSVDIPRDRQHPAPNATDKESVLGAAVGSATGVLKTRLFAGPKSIDLLASVHTANGKSLEPVVSFGWFSWVAKPMLLVLRFFVVHGVGNWGWSILILTFILNLAMIPTRVMMMKSSLKMQRIQPQIDAIKAKYSKYKTTDPRRQEMNKEMFDLQRKEGVNMFGGCLPMLLQYPLLYGFYEMLEYSIELRQAHWLWLPDLSAADPWHILPVFVIVSMFLSQFLTPSPGMDQSQQRMMAFMMPVIFGFMMWNLGSGVDLYWVGSNIMGVGTQIVMNRTSMGREMREIAARRAAKKRAAVRK